MKIQSEILAVERKPDGLLIQFAGGGIRGAVVIEAPRDVPLVGQALTFEYAMPGATAGADPLVGLIPPRAATAAGSSTSSSNVTSPGAGVSASVGSSGRLASTNAAGSDALLAFMSGGRNVPLTDRDVESELDAFVGTRDEVQRGLALMRRR